LPAICTVVGPGGNEAESWHFNSKAKSLQAHATLNQHVCDLLLGTSLKIHSSTCGRRYTS